MKKKYPILFLVFIMLLTTVSGCKSPAYRGDNPELYTLAIHNFFGSYGYGINGEITFPAETGVIEKDSYGRVLFYYHEGINDEGCGYGILQKLANGYVYYYEDDCVLCAENNWSGNGKVTYEEWFTAEELSAFKARNDWEKEINDEKCTKEFVVSRKPEGRLRLKENDFEEATKGWLTDNGFQIISDYRIYTSEEFFVADDYGREIYCIYVNESRLAGNIEETIILAVMFMPDGTCDPNVSVIRIEDMQNYRDQMKAFRQNNGWNTAYKKK